MLKDKTLFTNRVEQGHNGVFVNNSFHLPKQL